MGRSKAAPSLRTSAGARFTVMRSLGKAKPALRMAVLTRSRLSRTAESGNPTVAYCGSPAATSTSTRTSTASTPRRAAESTRAIIARLFVLRSARSMSGIGHGRALALPRSSAASLARRRFPADDVSDRVLRRMSDDDVLRPVALVVDDEESVRESFRLVLDQDYDVLDAPDGARALDIVRSHDVDVVLLDIRLPDMDGIEVLER